MPGRVLIAEDEEAIARLVQTSLEKAGYEATIALDGREAIRLIGIERFDFVVLDLLMPYYDGGEVLKRLRTTEWSRQIPVIILATCPPSEADELIRAYAYTPTQFIRKPFNPSELLAALADAAPSSAPEA
jgi:two-component system alkaline phosphatase synthesis response regulator PhoP